MRTEYEEIIKEMAIGREGAMYNLAKILALAGQEVDEKNFAKFDKEKKLLLAIDLQHDFVCPTGALPVKGAIGDVSRLLRWMYVNMNSITKIMCSLDIHTLKQIFFASWWINQEGEHPDAYTKITLEDVENGIWMPICGEPKESLDYVKYLDSVGKELVIWPYHCLKGLVGSNLEAEFAKMVYFHSVVRDSKPSFIEKGMNPYSEMYGIVHEEYNPLNIINHEVLESIKTYDRIFVAGEAASHCLLESVKQIAEYYKDNKELLKKITVLVDCTTPICTYDTMTRDEFEKLNHKYGINFAKTTEIVL